MNQRKYSEEFKREALKQVLEEGKSQKRVCAELGIGTSTLQ